ncbi:hypothetical protein [Streptomyces sp. NPDC053813]|uniref:hypothetical protein n=1 Tax=Streptomyces sp. NPDC053813 TaxID=3365717 RepID=UPI0037CDAA42
MNTDTDPNYVRDRITEAAAEAPVTEDQTVAAYRLLYDLMGAAWKHDVQLSDFDRVADLPAICLRVARTLDLRPMAKHEDTHYY